MNHSLTKPLTPQQESSFNEEYCLTFDIIHCSDPIDGEKEIALFFNKNELVVKTLPAETKLIIMKDLISYKHQTQFKTKIYH